MWFLLGALENDHFATCFLIMAFFKMSKNEKVHRFSSNVKNGNNKVVL